MRVYPQRCLFFISVQNNFHAFSYDVFGISNRRLASGSWEMNRGKWVPHAIDANEPSCYETKQRDRQNGPMVLGTKQGTVFVSPQATINANEGMMR